MIIQGDCVEVMKTLEGNSIDAVVTDPPYGIGFMGKGWDTFEPKHIKKVYKPQRKKLVHKYDIKDSVKVYRKKAEWVVRESASDHAGQYDRSPEGVKQYQDWCYLWAKECLRVLKPGGHLLASNSSRMYHRMAVAIEDAGFEIRDQIMWLYGSGFPKSLNIGKAINKMDGVEFDSKPAEGVGFIKPDSEDWHQTKNQLIQKGESSERAKKWEGWGTALKPAHEPIVVARKPLSEKTVAQNVLKWGTGGLNIDGSRVAGAKPDTVRGAGGQHGRYSELSAQGKIKDDGKGRFPANLILDEEAGEMLDKQVPETSKGYGVATKGSAGGQGSMFKQGGMNPNRYDMGGLGASRFFYCAKASKSERNKGLEGFEEKERVDYGGFHSEKGLIENNRNPENRKPSTNNHPTVKPISLMRYLCKLITPPKGLVLDPFVGSGTTGIACKLEEFDFIGIEKEPEYVKIAEARIKAWKREATLF